MTTIYKSSAGSGKTYTLAKEYIKLALKEDNSYRHILAVTFTNKATDELKSRVIGFLVDLSEGENDELKKQIEKETGLQDIEKQSKSVLENILHNYSDFSISTIDSFFSKIFRSFTRELKIRQGFDIEMDTKMVLNEITDNLLDRSGSDDSLTEFLEEFIIRNINDEKSWNIDDEIKKIGGEIFKERYWEKKIESFESGKVIIDDINTAKETIRKIRDLTHIFEKEMQEISMLSEKLINKHKLEYKDFAYGSSGVIGYLINKIRDNSKFTNYEPGKRTISALENPDNFAPKKSPIVDKIKAVLDDGLYSCLTSAIELYKRDFKTYKSAKILNKTIYVNGIFSELLTELDKYRSVNGVILQSDVNSILRSVISMEASPFIYEKTGNKLNHFLIDEFQDTSTFQWKNLLPLIINSLSEQGDCLIVGDVKQAIYRWRGGNMKLLLYNVLDDLKSFNNVKQKILKDNHRSCEEIVKFNNVFFPRAAEMLTTDINENPFKNIILDSYSEDKVKQSSKYDKGYVRIEFLTKGEEDADTEEILYKKISLLIKKLLENYQLRDILVLVRKNTESNKIADILSAENYNIVSEKSLLLNYSPSVRLLIEALKYLSDNRNTLAKTLLYYNWERYFKDRIVDFGKVEEFIRDVLPQGFFDNNCEEKFNSALNNLTVYELIEHLIRIFNLNSEPDPYLIKFQSVVLDFSGKYSTDIPSFLEWWRLHFDELYIAVPEGKEAIKIMTIHKAKGLQSKVVIVPFANWEYNPDGKKDLFWVSSSEEPFTEISAYFSKVIKDLDDSHFHLDYQKEFVSARIDNLNLLYVALTRPEQELYVFVPDKPKNRNNVGELLKKVIQNDAELSLKMNDSIFKLGTSLSGIRREEKETDIVSETLDKCFSNEWYKKIIIKPKSGNIRLLIDKEFARKTNRGIIIHDILAMINTAGDIDTAVNKVMIEGIINDIEASDLKEELTRILRGDIIHDWFSDKWTAMNERDILLPDGKIVRPDRVLINGTDIIVIDYKTGLEKNEHKTQIEQYAKILLSMGYTSVKKYLLYINEETPVKIKIKEI
ncbi:hypothetical protein D4R20_00635 [bacterium]|nr:MAG: hypothetical protein D4R20_00635 [bacterium]